MKGYLRHLAVINPTELVIRSVYVFKPVIYRPLCLLQSKSSFAKKVPGEVLAVVTDRFTAHGSLDHQRMLTVI